MTVWMRNTMRAGTCALLLGLGACGDDTNDAPEPGDGSSGDGSADGSPADGSADGNPGDGSEDGSQGDGSEDGSQGDGEADGDAGEAPSVDACLGEAESQETKTERLVLAAEGLAVGFVRHQDPDGFGTSGTTVWLLDRVAVSDASESQCVSETAQLVYTGSYHNFDDSLAATVGDVTFTITQKRQGYDFPTAFALTKKAGDVVVYGPTDLTLVSCTSLNDDSDCGERYGL